MIKIEDMHLRDVFFNELLKKMENDRNIMLLTNDMGAPSLDQFKEKVPEQLVNMGITEQNIVGTAAGLSSRGKKVVIYSISTFITLRSLEQIKLDLCVMKLPAIIVTVGAGYSYAVDGPTHHAIDDISVMNTLANMNIYSPSDSLITKNITTHIFKFKKINYLRLERGVWPILSKKTNIKNGFRIVSKGDDLCIVSTANMVHKSLSIANELQNFKINTTVIDLFRIKPLQDKELLKILKNFKKICVLEEQTENGGMGSIILNNFHSLVKKNTNFLNLGIKDQFLYTYGKRDKIHSKAGLDKDSIKRKLLNFYNK